MNDINQLVKKYFDNLFTDDIDEQFRKWWTNNELTEEKEKAMQEIWEADASLPGDNTLIALDTVRARILATKSQKRKLLYPILIAASLILLPVASAWLTYYFTHTPAVKTMKSEFVECFVPNGERKYLVLSDGSEVWLNAGSILIYSKHFDEDNRTLFLSGEANFKVQPDVRRPFRVKTKFIDVLAVGTVFNVQAYPDLEITTTSLEEGKVKVSTKDENQQALINPNQQVEYNHQTNELITKTIDAQRNSNWKHGYLIFESASFAKIIHTLERKFDVTIHYEAKLYQNKRYTVKFSPDEDLAEVMGILKEMIKGLDYKIRNDVVYIQ